MYPSKYIYSVATGRQSISTCIGMDMQCSLVNSVDCNSSKNKNAHKTCNKESKMLSCTMLTAIESQVMSPVRNKQAYFYIIAYR